MRQQIASQTSADTSSPSTRWLEVLVLGWMFLTILPATVTWSASFKTGGSTEYIAYGLGIGAPWTQCTILFFVLIFLDVRQSHKFLILANATVGLVFCWFSLRHPEVSPYQYTLLTPIVAGVISIPAIAFRIAYHWAITHESSDVQSKPASIATYLLLTLAVALTISAVSWLPRDIRDEIIDMDFLATFGGPIVACMLIAIPTMVYFLNRQPLHRSRSIYMLCIWDMFCVMLSVCAMLCRANFDSPSEAFDYGLFGLSFAITFTFWFSLGMGWLRLLGFRLQRGNDVHLQRPQEPGMNSALNS